MIKKAVVATSSVALLGFLVFGTDLASYVWTSAGWVKESVRDSVPIEFEIERARKMVKELVPEIRQNMVTIAREEVEVEQLAQQVADLEDQQQGAKQDLMRLRTDLGGETETFQYAGREYSRQQVKMDLANRFERFKTNDATLASLQQIRDARSRSLEHSREKLEGMLAAKRNLEVEVENLDARLAMIEAAETTSEYNFDDSRLGRVRELIGDLRTKLDVAAKMVDAEGKLHPEIPLDHPVSDNILDEVTEYFSDGLTEKELAEK